MNIIKKIVKFLALEILLTAICVGIVFLTHSFGCAKGDSEDVGKFVEETVKDYFEKRQEIPPKSARYTFNEVYFFEKLDDEYHVRVFAVKYSQQNIYINIKAYFSEDCKDNTMNKICKKHLIKVECS